MEARDELFMRFEWFRKKYSGFFRSEADAIRLARQYTDVAAFLGLFMGKKMFHTVQSRRWNGNLQNQIVRKVNEIHEMSREIGDQEDMDSIIDLTFLEMISKYDPKAKVRKELKKQGIDYDLLSKSQKRRWEEKIPAVGFEGYVQNVFKWRLFKNIEAETKGVIPGVGWCKAYVTKVGGQDGSKGSEEDVNLAEMLSEETIEMDDIIGSMMVIDHDWVDGTTASPPFDELTVQERWIIKMKFVDRLSSREIGESIGASSSVIRSRFNEIIAKVGEHVELRERWNSNTKQYEPYLHIKSRRV